MTVPRIPRYLVLSGSYSYLSGALYEGTISRASFFVSPVRASAQLVPLLRDEIFTPLNLTIAECDFIAVDAGPGAFTSLRVVLATVNGLAFAAKVPVVALDGMAALSAALAPYRATGTSTAVLLNAYNQEVYYDLQPLRSVGYAALSIVLAKLQALPGDKVVIAGNCIPLYAAELSAALGGRLESVAVVYPPLAQLAIQSLERWDPTASPVYAAQPLYLKEQVFKKAL